MKQVSILDALFMLRHAWNLVTGVTVTTCFSHSGFITQTSKEDQLEIICDTDLNNDVNNIFDHLALVTNLSPYITVEDFLNLDNNILHTSLLSERDIVDIINQIDQPHEDSDNEIEIDLPMPSLQRLVSI